MRRAGLDAFFPITVKCEGKTPFCYLDLKGLVTTGIGNLVDSSAWDPALGRTKPPEDGKPWASMVELPFKHPDGSLCTEREKIIEWCWIWGSVAPDEPLEYDPDKNPFRKQRLLDAQRGGFYFRKMCKYHLDDIDIMKLVMRKLTVNEKILVSRFPEFAEWPVSAELALHLLAWACGSRFHFPRLEAHLRKREFAIYAEATSNAGVDAGELVLVGGAAIECKIDAHGNPGVKPRNAIMRQLFEEAEGVQSMGDDFEVLHYPDVYGGQAGPLPSKVGTPDPDDTAPYSEDTLLGLGTFNPNVIADEVKEIQDELDKKRGDG